MLEVAFWELGLIFLISAGAGYLARGLRRGRRVPSRADQRFRHLLEKAPGQE